MPKIDHGGPAFPNAGNQDFAFYPDRGMSLRDWFAGQQLARIASGWPNSDNMRKLAANCYAMADAMLAERAKASTETDGV